MASLHYSTQTSETESCDVCGSLTLDLELLPCTHLVCVRCFEEAAVSGGSITGCIICDTTSAASERFPSTHRSPPCHLCNEDAPSIAYCTNCSIYLCEFCEQAHVRQKRTSNHRVIILELATTTNQIEAQEYFCPPSLPSCPHFDSAHPTSGYFCEGCVQFMCPRCKETHHQNSRNNNNNNNHLIIPMTDMSLHVFEKLQNLLSKTQPLVSTLKDSVHVIDTLMGNIDEKIEQNCEDVCQIIDTHIALLEEHKITLLTELNRIKETKLTTLSRQVNTLAHALDSIHETCAETSHVLTLEQQDRHGNEAEDDLLRSLSIKISLALKLEELTETRYEYRPAEDDYVRFQPFVQFERRNGFQIHGIIDTKAPSAIHSTIKLLPHDHTSSGYLIKKPVNLLLTIIDREGKKKIHGGDYIELRVIGPNNISLKNHQIIDLQDGSYKLIFTPNAIGEYKVIVLIGSRYVQGTPLFVQVNEEPVMVANSEGKEEGGVTSGCGLNDGKQNNVQNVQTT